MNPSELANATIVELRKFAKDRGIVIGALRTKSDILDHIQKTIIQQVNEAGLAVKEPQVPQAPKEEKAAEQPAPSSAASQQASERRAMIIADDSDDIPILTASRPATGPQPKPQAAPAAPAVRQPQLTSTGKAKPVFNLTGARAWHNPQSYAAQSAPPAGKASPYQASGDSFTSTMQTRPVPSRAPRFGPEAARAAEAAAAATVSAPAVPAIPQGYRPSAFAQPGAARYQQPLAEAAADVVSAYRRPPVDYAAPVMPDVAEVRSYPASVLRREPMQPRDPGGINPAVPEMLATGDCGDDAGVLESHPDGYGFLRAGNFLPGKNDVYISNAQIRRFALRDGDYVEGKTRPQREGDRYAAMLYITSINGQEPEEAKKRRDFDDLTPVYPDRRLQLSSPEQNDPVLRFIDLFVPIGFGQRALIVAPPKAGKTTILKKIALSMRGLHPDVHLMTLLVDERPEEVTDLKETVGGDVFYSTFDEPAENHARVSELVIDRAKRLVEQGKDVVILMDSLTRLSRAYNTIAPHTARIMSGGLAAGALNKPKRFFGAARNMKEGGSLTIIATAIVETGSRMDDMIYEEFKGTGNMELMLDRALQEQRIFPAVSIVRAGTRYDELLLSRDEETVALRVRRMIAGSSEQEGISMVLSMMDRTKDNEDFVARFDQWAKMMGNGGARQ